MQILQYIFFDLGPLVFGFLGLALSSYIYIKKQNAEPLVCPLRGECDLVTQSRYSKFLGIAVEKLGMIYYTLIVSVYALHGFLPGLLSDTVMFLTAGVTVGAFIFSLYLIFIQAFVLRKWCTWCIFSACFSTFIFITAFAGIDIDLPALLHQYKSYIIILHALAAAVALGSATVTDILFFKFLKDYRISESENATMRTLSGVIWLALGIIIVTGIGLFIPESERLLQSSKFLLKVVAVAVVTVNGILLNLVVSPKMISLDFGGASDGVRDLRNMRRLSYALGAISIVSWYLIFIHGSLKSIPLKFPTALGIYLGILIAAVMMSQVTDRKMVEGYKKEHPDQNNPTTA